MRRQSILVAAILYNWLPIYSVNKGRFQMKRFNDSKITLLLLAFAVAFMLAAGSANADFTFGDPVNVESVISFIDPDTDGIECLSLDGLEIYISSGRGTGQGRGDVWVLRRASIDADWSAPENLGSAVNTPHNDVLASISPDGLTLYFCSDRPYGDNETYDVFVTTRATKNDPWGQAVNAGPAINGPGGCNYGVCISPDNLELYVNSSRPGGYARQDIWVARRATANDPWRDAVNIGPVVNTEYSETECCLSPDGLLLLFSDPGGTTQPRPGGYGSADIWMARRATLSDPWQAPVNLGPKINGPADDAWPVISPDGRTLYYSTESAHGYDNCQAPILRILDFNGDAKVDLKDFCRLAQYWGQSQSSVDIGPMPWGDGIVDLKDLLVFSAYWLTGLGPISHWNLDETDGWAAHDSAGAHDGFVMTANPLWRPVGGKINGALELDGTDDYVSTPFILDPGAGPFSVFAWVKGGAAGQVVISQKGGADWLCADPSEGKLMTGLKATDQGQPLISHSVITDGQWHKVGLSWDGSNRILYVDNAEVAKDTQAGLTGSQGGLQIGAGKGLEAGTFWSGLIDDVQIYDRAVTP
jgi:hypothetical protein